MLHPRVSAAIVVLAAVLTLLGLGATTASAAFQGTNGRIYFISDSNVWSINADGSNPQQVTNQAWLQYENPAVSPDGSKIAFEAPDGMESNILVVPIGGGATTDATANVTLLARNPEWTANGSDLLFHANNPANISYMDLFRITPGASNASQLTDTDTQSALDVASGSDGSIVYQNGLLGVYALGGGLISEATGHSADVGPHGGIVYAKQAVGGTQLFSGSGQITTPGVGAGAYLEPSISPDGTKIVAIQHLGPLTGTMWVLNIDGSNPVRITGPGKTFPHDTAEPDWGVLPGTGGSTTPPTNTPPTGNPSTNTMPTPVADTTKPTVTLVKPTTTFSSTTLLANGLTTTIQVGEKSTLTQELFISGATKGQLGYKKKPKPPIKLGSGTVKAAAAGKFKVKVKLTTAAKAKLKALKKAATVKLDLVTRVTDAAGNVTVRTTKVMLKVTPPKPKK